MDVPYNYSDLKFIQYPLHIQTSVFQNSGKLEYFWVITLIYLVYFVL